MRLARFVATFGNQLQRHKKLIQAIQWFIVLFYLLLLVVPTFMDLPPRQAHILNNFVLFAQFIFWGIWWPFVILSMLIIGRLWCGVFCPEGTLTEWTSRSGRNKQIPRWIKWRGWPTAAFILTTLYGQLISVYDYAEAALLILGGSTLAAMLIGYLYGRGTRVWCRYLCPVNGVFNLLSRLAPVSFKTDQKAWEQYSGKKQQNPNCPPMISIHQLNGVSGCHMCGRCSGFRDAVSLQPRAPTEEVVHYGVRKNNNWEISLLLFGMIGVAIGAFTWTVSPWFIHYKQFLAQFLVQHDIFWPLDANAPWWVLTNHPANNDSFNWLDGFCISTYILASGVLYGLFLTVLLQIAAYFNQNRDMRNHLAQALLPIAAAGLFLGLTATTTKLLLYSGVSLPWLNGLRLLLLAGATCWSFYLGTQVLQTYALKLWKQAVTMVIFALCLAPIVLAWWLMFWQW